VSTNRNESNIKKIQVSKNGPYIVIGRIPLAEQTIVCDPDGTSVEWRAGKEYPPQEKCTLCRCGHSKNKPFCDGTHMRIGFDGTETAAQEKYLDHPKEHDGPNLRLIDVEELCASARFCHRAGGIWNLIPKSDDPALKKTAVEEACDCPSGRLVVFDKKAQQIIEAELRKSIGLIEDPWIGVKGPILVSGYVPIKSAEGKNYRVRNRVTLCRCGKSSNKPFCDSSHYPEAETVEEVHTE
jgi:CDGSH-type Zn-finger protein